MARDNPQQLSFNSIQVLAFADAIRRWPDLRRTIGYFSRPGLAWLFNVAQIQ